MAKKLKIPTSKKREKPQIFFFNKSDDTQKTIGIKSHIELFSNEEITVEGCRGILDYNEQYIKLRLIKGGVILFGDTLLVTFFENSTIRIKGKISALEFCG